MKLSKIAILFAAMIALILSTQPAHATSMVPVNLAQIVKYTQSGFVGTCDSVETVKTDQGWADKVTFEVTQTIIGDAPADGTIVWYQARMGEAAPIAGMPKFAKDGEYMIFLTAKSGNSIFQAPFALGQGAFKITRSADGTASVSNEFGGKYLYSNIDTGKLRTDAAAVAADRAAKSTQKGAAAPKNDGLNSLANQARALAASKDPVKDYEKATPEASNKTLSAPAVLVDK